MQRALVWLVGFALVVEAIGLPLLVLERPAVTRVLAQRYALATEAGLSSRQTLELAEDVRVFVVRGGGELPARVDGRGAFDAAAGSHLEDVRGVLASARLATGLLAIALAVVLGWTLAHRREDLIGSALKAGATLTTALIALAVVGAVTDFDTFFSAFHGLFFDSGTWTFPAGSLLIQLFPEPFWATLGAIWAGLTVLLAVSMGIAGVLLGRSTLAHRA